MSFVQSSVASQQRGPFGAEPARSALDLRPVLGLGLVGLGVGMLCLGIFHGFEHGSCSTTGYSRNYGPVAHCSKGTGWWMLMLMAGLVVAGGGAALARCVGSLMLPLVFVAIGARSSHWRSGTMANCCSTPPPAQASCSPACSGAA